MENWTFSVNILQGYFFKLVLPISLLSCSKVTHFSYGSQQGCSALGIDWIVRKLTVQPACIWCRRYFSTSFPGLLLTCILQA